MDYKIRLFFTLARVVNCQKLHKRDITNDGYTWWLIPRIVSGLVHPNDLHGIFGAG